MDFLNGNKTTVQSIFKSNSESRGLVNDSELLKNDVFSIPLDWKIIHDLLIYYVL